MNKDPVKKTQDAWVEWKKSYIELLISKLKPTGEVLQVGYGSGMAAECIQEANINNHTIIESDAESAKKAKLWAKKHSGVKVIEDTWQNTLPKLGIFDTIFFYDTPMPSEIEIFKIFNRDQFASISNQAKETLEILEEQMSKIVVKFSDEQINEFYQNVGRFHLNKLPRFFEILKNRGNITEAQYHQVQKKYHFDSNAVYSKNSNPMLEFLEDCIRKHMKKGSRFSGFLVGSASKYQDTDFFEKIITNPELDYKEELVSINIAHFQPIESLIMIVEKST